MTAREPRLGVDIGRVIIAGSTPDGADTAFFRGGLDNALRTPSVAGSFEALSLLARRFAHRLWLISKCQERVEQRTRAWLEHHDFFARTEISADNLLFCRRRSDKAPICATLGITHFVDDRIEVLVPMRDVVSHLYLFGARPQPSDEAWLTAVPDWPAGVELIQPDPD